MSKFRVLLVDDEVELLQALSERLRLRGFDVAVARSGEKALALIEAVDIDFMVLDLKMPGIDGMTVLRTTRRSHPRVEVIMLTGHGAEREREEALRLGAFEYLQKPVDIGELLEALHRAAASRR